MWQTFLVILILYGFIIITSELAIRKYNNAFVIRKIAHICCGILTALLPYFLALKLALMIGLLLAIFVIISKQLHIFTGLEYPAQKNWGTLYFPLGFMLSALLFWNINTLIFSGSALILGLSDGCAALFGKRFGVKKYKNSKKSYVGTYIFMFVTMCITVGIYTSNYGSFWSMTFSKLITVIAGSAIIALIEAYAEYGTDNLFIPLAGGFLLFLIL